MSTRRSLLCYPALFGVALLLFSGVREAYGFGSCPMMHPGGGQGEVVEMVEAGSEGAHAHHPMPVADAQHEGHGSDQAEGCECRVLCLSVPAPTPPEPLVLSFDPVLPPEPSTAPAVEDARLLPKLHPPFLLPFANAPPEFS